MRGLTAFREAYLMSDVANETQFESWEARGLRYQIYWSFYENTTYQDAHTWAQSMKHKNALYKYVRSLYNPAYRIGNFYSAHLWGGALDSEGALEGSIPIVAENLKLYPAILQLWRNSRMGRLKDVVTLRGSIEGDVVLRVRDDPEKGKVYLERVNPGTVVDLEKDSFGNIKAYTLEETRPDPKGSARSVTYAETATRDGELVVFRTYLNGAPFGWDGNPEAWEEPYGFIPMVHWPHNDVGLDWGWSELQPMRSKVFEVDDLASMISDQIRKTVDPVWLMKGSREQSLTVTGASRAESGGTDTRPQPGREELKAIWSPSDKIQADPLIAPLQLNEALTHITALLAELERDYPELQTDIWASGATSGRALRVARQRLTTKVVQRREGYDEGLVRAQQMALSIGSLRGYDGFAGLGKYEGGALDHEIGERPVFPVDPLDDVEISRAFWEAAGAAVKAGASLEGYLLSQGYKEEQIAPLLGRTDDPPWPTQQKRLGRWNDI